MRQGNVLAGCGVWGRLVGAAARVEVLEGRALLSEVGLGYAQTEWVTVDRADLLAGPRGTAKTYRAVESFPTGKSSVGKTTAGKSGKGAETVVLSSGSRYMVSMSGLRSVLKGASKGGEGGTVVLSLPTPEGELASFEVRESSILDAKLSRKFKSIKTYEGVLVGDESVSVRLSVTGLGLSAQVLGWDVGTGEPVAWYIDPLFRGNSSYYGSYYRTEMEAPGAYEGYDLVGDAEEVVEEDEVILPGDLGEIVFGGSRRTFRLAVSATGEYTSLMGGGTVSGAMAAIVTAVNRVAGIYRQELDVSFVIVSGSEGLIYTNASTDPFNNNNATQMIAANVTAANGVVGEENYDIGHVFATGGGAASYKGSVGGAQKAGGASGYPAPVGDVYYVDVLAHEMGHQFGASHTFNTSLDPTRNGGTAYEPGSGSTIMGQAGLEGVDDIQGSASPFFHSASIDEIRAFLETIPEVGTVTDTGNGAPTVSAGVSYVIPALTPFALTAVGWDPDGDKLTYDWQQRDLGPARRLSDADNGSSPLFRVYNPTESATRVLPRMQSVLAGSNNTAGLYGSSNPSERLPTVSRSAMNWRVVARDGKGGVATSDVTLTVVATGSSGFSVTSPNTVVSWASHSTQTVTWNVAGTTGNGINTANVRISLSVDGGNTFPYVLKESTTNDGTEQVTLPFFNMVQSSARIKVEALGNIFFDVSNVNFAIGAYGPPVAPALTAGSDTGSSSSDRITRLNNDGVGNALTFTVGSTVSGEMIRLFANGTEVGSATATGTVTTITTTGSLPLADGTVAFTATRAIAQGTSVASGSTIVTIDTTPGTASVTAPAVAVRNGAVASVTVAFSEAVTGGTTSSYSISRDGVSVSLGSTTFSGSGASRTIGGLTSLTTATGVYVVSFSTEGISDLAGNAFAAVTVATRFTNNVLELPSEGTGNTLRLVSTSASGMNVFLNNTTASPTYMWTFTEGQVLRVVGSGLADRVGIWSTNTYNAALDARFGEGEDVLRIETGNYTASGALGSNVEVEVGEGAKVTVKTAVEWRRLEIERDGLVTLEAPLVVGSLGIAVNESGAATGMLNIGSQPMGIRTGEAEVLRGYVASWFARGKFSGKGIGNPAGGTGTGRDELASVGLRGNGVWNGEETVRLWESVGGIELDAGAFVLKYTYRGDLDLNGVVSEAEIEGVVRGIRWGGTGWENGDLNYDGRVDSQDLADALIVRFLQREAF